MHIYLTHLIHGAKIAISDTEAEYDEQHGWVRYDPDSMVTSTTESLGVANAFAKRKYNRKNVEPENVTEGN